MNNIELFAVYAAGWMLTGCIVAGTGGEGADQGVMAAAATAWPVVLPVFFACWAWHLIRATIRAWA